MARAGPLAARGRGHPPESFSLKYARLPLGIEALAEA